MVGRIYRIAIIGVVILAGMCLALVYAYRKGVSDTIAELRLAENERFIEEVAEKEEITAAVAKQTVAERRKGLNRYVIK